MRPITAQTGWTAVKAIPDKSTDMKGFKINKYPVIGWQVHEDTVSPITPIGVLERGFIATIDLDGGVFGLGLKFSSVDEWLEHITKQYKADS